MKRKSEDHEGSKRKKIFLIHPVPPELWMIVFSFLHPLHFMKIRILSKDVYNLPWKEILKNVKFVLKYEKYKMYNNDFTYVSNLFIKNIHTLIGETLMKKIRLIPKLDLQSYNYTYQIVQILTNDHKIKKLKLRAVNLMENDLKLLSKIKNLTLTFCRFNNYQDLRYLKDIKTLKLIFFQGGNESLQCFSGIKKLTLVLCSQITDEGLKYLKRIENLTIDANHRITDLGISYIFNVKSLTLNRCTQLTANCLQYLKNIEKLDVIDCIPLIDTSIFYIKGIKSLSLYNSDITEKSFIHLKSLKQLSLMRCKDFNSNAFKYLENLEELKIEDCPNVKDDHFKYLKNLKRLYVDSDHNSLRNFII